MKYVHEIPVIGQPESVLKHCWVTTNTNANRGPIYWFYSIHLRIERDASMLIAPAGFLAQRPETRGGTLVVPACIYTYGIEKK